MVLISGNTLYNILFTLVLLVFVIYLYFKYCYTYWKKLGVPFLEPKFPFGNVKDTLQGKETIGVTFNKIYNELKRKGCKYGGIYFFQVPMFMPICPELIKNMLIRDFNHFYDRGVYHNEEDDPLSAHLFSLEGQKWKNLRNKLTPTFTSGKLKKMFQTLVDCSVELKNCLNEPISKREPIDIKQILVQYTTDVIGSCAFGIECNSFKNPNTEFIKHGKKIFNPAFLDRSKMFFAFSMTEIAKLFRIKIINSEVDFFYRNLIKETVEYREKNNVTRNDFLQLLIQLKNKQFIDDNNESVRENNETTLTLNELSAQAFLFFIGGFETSSTALTWCFFEISLNQSVQEKLREEIKKVLSKYDNQITYDALVQMNYMERVIQETLRKYPPFQALQRIVTQDYVLPDTNIVLKKGTRVMIPNFGLQKDPEYFPDPEKFDPDRFTDENKANRPDCTWLPFGDGPRNCIGLRFALLQVKVGLCQLLLNYKFTLNPETVNPPIFDPLSFVTSAKDNILLNAEKI